MKSRQGDSTAKARRFAWSLLVTLAAVGISAGGLSCSEGPDPADPHSREPAPIGSIVGGIQQVGSCDTQDCSVEAVSTNPEVCTVGECPPGEGNARGIYIAKDSNYCFQLKGTQYVCPEAFVNTAEGLQLEVRYTTHSSVFAHPVQGHFRETPQSTPVPVKLLGIHSDRTRLAIRYRTPDTQEHTAQGAELSKLTLLFVTEDTPGGSPFSETEYEMEVIALGEGAAETPDGIHSYTVRYREAALGGPWLHQCEAMDEGGKSLPVSFLGGKRIHGMSAFVTDDPQAVTMACDTGAIVSCLRWGYTPWNTLVKEPDRNQHVFGACLQAKRAAYFVGQGDYTSYTKTGTPIFRRDQYGINAEEINALEAIWSPAGAVCLNPENARGKGRDDVPQIQDTHGVPECGKPPEWSRQGKLATSPKEVLSGMGAASSGLGQQ